MSLRRYIEIAEEDIETWMLKAAGVPLKELVPSNHVKRRFMLPIRLRQDHGPMADQLPAGLTKAQVTWMAAQLTDKAAVKAKIKGSSKAYWDKHNKEPDT